MTDQFFSILEDACRQRGDDRYTTLRVAHDMLQDHELKGFNSKLVAYALRWMIINRKVPKIVAEEQPVYKKVNKTALRRRFDREIAPTLSFLSDSELNKTWLRYLDSAKVVLRTNQKITVRIFAEKEEGEHVFPDFISYRGYSSFASVRQFLVFFVGAIERYEPYFPLELR